MVVLGHFGLMEVLGMGTSNKRPTCVPKKKKKKKKRRPTRNLADTVSVNFRDWGLNLFLNIISITSGNILAINYLSFI